jgi:hypothetical protein
MIETIERAKERFAEDEALAPEDPTSAELAECTCPEFCERDHDNE